MAAAKSPKAPPAENRSPLPLAGGASPPKVVPVEPEPELLAELSVSVARSVNGRLRITVVERSASEPPNTRGKGWVKRTEALLEYMRALEALKQFVFGGRGML